MTNDWLTLNYQNNLNVKIKYDVWYNLIRKFGITKHINSYRYIITCISVNKINLSYFNEKYYKKYREIILRVII